MIPMPVEFDMEQHVAKLYESLNPKSPSYERESQHVNIRALINLYESGKRKSNVEEVWIMGGKVVTKKEALTTKEWAISEVCSLDNTVQR
jgi:hypothetical protein